MKKLLMLFLSFFTAQAYCQVNIDGLYKIYDTKTGKEVTVGDIAQAFNNADVLFFGEEHDDSIGHILEQRIFEQSHALIGPLLALSMEMFETDVQLVVNEYTAGLISEKNFIKEARAWSNYRDYKPLVEYAKAKRLNVIAANTPARYTNAVTRGGLEVLQKFGPISQAWLPPPPIDTAAGKYYEKFLTIMDGHGVMPGFHIFQSQNLWDATMAWNIHFWLRRHQQAKVMHLNGRFHSDEKMGVVAQLKKYAERGNTKVNILNISCFYLDNIDKPDWSKYSGLGDFIIITQKFKKEDTKN